MADDHPTRDQRTSADIAAYVHMPPTDAELAIADLPVDLDVGDEDVNYDEAYGSAEG